MFGGGVLQIGLPGPQTDKHDGQLVTRL